MSMSMIHRDPLVLRPRGSGQSGWNGYHQITHWQMKGPGLTLTLRTTVSYYPGGSNAREAWVHQLRQTGWVMIYALPDARADQLLPNPAYNAEVCNPETIATGVEQVERELIRVAQLLTIGP